MSATRQPGDASRVLAKHEQRLDDLERQLAALLKVPAIGLPFNLPDVVEVSESVPWQPILATETIITIVALLGTPGTDQTVIEVRVDGVATATITMDTGVTRVESAVRIVVSPTQIVTVAVTSTPGDAEDLDVILGFR